MHTDTPTPHPSTLSPRQALLGMTPEELERVATDLGLPRYVGGQIRQWLYEKKVLQLEEMTNISRRALHLLAENFHVGAPTPAGCQRSVDGTVKYLFRTTDGHFVESVFIPDGDRGTLCVSSQVGCRMGCHFCMTGRQGLRAQLSVADILGQVHALPERAALTNIVFMGQGEPLDNWDNVLRATNALTAPWGYAWSPKRITVSTVGLRKGLRRLVEECRCHVAVSLHHPLPEGRAALMPAERAMSITEIVDTLRNYEFCRKGGRGESRQRRLSFEYIVLDGINDSLQHADALLRLLRGLDCRVNLIRFHSIPDTDLQGVSEKRMLLLRDYLTSHGIFATIRASRGEDIYAACGLLSTKRQEEQLSM